MEEKRKILEKYFTPQMSLFILNQITENNVLLKLTPKRVGKRGDYRPHKKGNGHIITLNVDFNKYRMLITWIHEYAHLLNWNENKNRVKPHGVEWKEKFRFVLLDAMALNLFPPDIDRELYLQFLKKETFTGQANTALENALRKYDNTESLILNDLPDGSRFKTKNGMIFTKGKKLRKRFECVEEKTQRKYTVHGFAEVELISQ
jgi:hypothetical protein